MGAAAEHWSELSTGKRTGLCRSAVSRVCPGLVVPVGQPGPDITLVVPGWNGGRLSFLCVSSVYPPLQAAISSQAAWEDFRPARCRFGRGCESVGAEVDLHRPSVARWILTVKTLRARPRHSSI